MKLAELIQDLPDIQLLNPEVFEALAQMPVHSITSDSRKVQSGVLFTALIGSHTDGHQYLSQAAQAGALALVIDASRQSKIQLPTDLPVFVAQNTYKALADLASRLHGEPGKKMRLVGVTGTNGKTTVTHLIEKILLDQDRKVGLIGTFGQKRGQKGDPQDPHNSYQSTGHTTPMAVELQEILAEMTHNQTEYVVMEVSSHALEQYRVQGCEFEVAVLTNVTQDHLDFHKTMENYWQAKALLFSQLNPKRGPRSAVINLDSNYAEGFLKACPPGVKVYTYSLENPQANVRAEEVQYSISGASFTAVTPEGSAPVRLQIAGRFSVYNALAAIAAGIALGIPLNDCIASMEAVQGVRGRFEVVSEKPFVIVDYAHTPDGLENVLSAARVVTPEGGRLIAVFGCGGDRDATKRPKMGRIAEQLADVLVVTSDNPRTEDPQQILSDILTGIQRFNSETMVVNADRKQAIHQAIDLAQPNDVIVVAGKGHEDYQILKDRTIHFDDREVVQEYIAQRRTTATPS